MDRSGRDGRGSRDGAQAASPAPFRAGLGLGPGVRGAEQLDQWRSLQAAHVALDGEFHQHKRVTRLARLVVRVPEYKAAILFEPRSAMVRAGTEASARATARSHIASSAPSEPGRARVRIRASYRMISSAFSAVMWGCTGSAASVAVWSAVVGMGVVRGPCEDASSPFAGETSSSLLLGAYFRKITELPFTLPASGARPCADPSAWGRSCDAQGLLRGGYGAGPRRGCTGQMQEADNVLYRQGFRSTRWLISSASKIMRCSSSLRSRSSYSHPSRRP